MTNFELLNRYNTVGYLKKQKNHAFYKRDLRGVMDYEKAIYITRKSTARLFLVQDGKVIALGINIYNDILYTLKDNDLIK